MKSAAEKTPARLNWLVTFAALVLFFLPTSLPATEKVDFFYFNPDSVQSNFSLLKKEVEDFFATVGYNARFQGFSQQTDFDRLVRERRPGLVFVPSWYFKQKGKEMSLTPILTPLQAGKTNYTKVFLVRSGTTFNHDLTGKTIAATSMGIKTGEQLGHFFSNGHNYDFSRSILITTPKDADALYALALGQVDAAIVSRATIRKLGAVNKNIISTIQEIRPSKPVPMPYLCIVNGTLNQQEKDELRNIFLDCSRKKPLPHFMNMLQFDGWLNAGI